MKIIVVLLTIYQYIPFIKNKTRNRIYRGIMEYCDSKKYFKEYDFIIEDKELKEY